MNREFVKLKLSEKEKTALIELKKSIEQKYKLIVFKLFGSKLRGDMKKFGLIP